MRRSCLLLPALLAMTSPALSEPQQRGRTCFWPSEVTSFSSNGAPDRALVHISRRETWELTLARGCPDVDRAQRIAIRPRGGDRVCAGRPAELIVPTASGRNGQSCRVTNVRRLSPEEAAAADGREPKR